MSLKSKVSSGIAFMILFLLGLTWLPAQTSAPRVVFKEKQWDFGKIKQDEVVSHQFVFRNEGTAPLKVFRVSTSCGCTAALVSEKEIAPGKEGRLEVSFNSHGYAGKVIKYIYFESNDPVSPQIELSITAEVEIGPAARIDVDRNTIDLGICLEGEESAAKLLVKNVGQLELMIDTENPEFIFMVNGRKISFPYRIPAGKAVELEIRLRSKKGRTGLLRDYLLIKSNDPIRPTISIFISRYVVTMEELKKLFEKYKNTLGIK